jgi:PAS domain S-box-containing protein
MAISLEPGARPQPSGTAGAGAPSAAAPSATETRLRLIIESAPVSLTVTTHDGTVLAANARALRLFGIERLEQLVGTKFDRVIAADDRGQVTAAVDGVCKGADAHLIYRPANGAFAGRKVEMRAVPLRRDGATPAVCLAASWEIAEAAASDAAKAAPPPALEQALEETKAALAAITRTREAERLAVGDALLQTRQRLQAALAEAEQRHAEAAAQWTAERDALQAELGQTRDAAGTGASQLAALTSEIAHAREAASAATAQLESSKAELTHAREAARTLTSSLQERDRDLDEARQANSATAATITALNLELADARDAVATASAKFNALNAELARAREAASAASGQLAAVSADLAQTRDAAMMTAAQLASSNEQRLRAEEGLEASRYRVAELEAIVRELEERCAQVVADRQADRIEFHEMVRTEQSKYEALVALQAQREAALADISRLLQDAALRTDRLLGDKPVVPVGLQPAAEPAHPEPQAAGAATRLAEEDPWQF